MNFKKVAVKTEESLIKRTVQTVEIDFDFTQVYDCMYSLSFRLRSASSFQLLFYFLKHMSADNMIGITSEIYNNFASEMKQHSGKTISRQQFYNCLSDLTNAKIITKITRGQYFLNPHVLWRDDKLKRIEFIKQESLSKNYLAYNPKENLHYLEEPISEYEDLSKK